MLIGMRPSGKPSNIATWWRYITKAAANTAGRLTMENVTMTDLQTFTDAYFEALLWTEHTTDGESFLDDIYGIEDIDHDSVSDARQQCADFIAQAGDLIEDAGGYVAAGHDFLLTRNGHGTGFWGRGLGDIGERLTAIAVTFRPVHAFDTDDDRVYIEEG